MLNENSLGKLRLDLTANMSGLKKGMQQAKTEIKKSTDSMGNSFAFAKKAALAFIAILGIQGLARTLSNMAAQAKRLAILENTFKRLSKQTKYTFKDMELGMLNMAKLTGVSVKDQTEALQQLMNSVGGLMSPQDAQNILLPIALDWAAASGKTPKDAAKDIAEAWMGEAPEELLMPVKLKFEQSNPGKKFDDLTQSAKWKLIVGYLDTFKGAAEAAGNSLGGSFDRMKNSITDLFDVIFQSQNFDGLIGMFQKISNSVYKMAEEIKKGNIPPLLLAIQNALMKLFEILAKIDWTKLINSIDWDKTIKVLGALLGAIIVFKTAGPVSSVLTTLGGAFKGLWDGLKWLGAWAWTGLTKLGNGIKYLGGAIAGIGGGMLIWKFWKNFMNIGAGLYQMEKAPTIIRAIGNAINKLAMSKVLDVSAWTAQSAAVLGFFNTLRTKHITPKEAETVLGGLKAISSGFQLFIQSIKMDGFLGALKNLPMIVGMVGEQLGAAATVLGVSLGTIAAVAAAIIAAIVAFILAWKNNWAGLRDWTKEQLGQIGEVFKGVYEKSLKPLFDEIIGLFEPLWVVIKDIFSAIADFLEPMLNDIKGFFNGFSEAIKFVFKIFGIDLKSWADLWKWYLDKLKNYIGEIFKGVVDTLSAAAKAIGNVLGIIIEIFRGLIAPIKLALELLHALITGDFSKMNDALDEFFATIKSIWNNIFKYLGAIIGNIGQVIAGLGRMFFGAWTSIGDDMVKFSDKVGKWIGDFLGGISNWLRDLGKALVEGVSNFGMNKDKYLAMFDKWIQDQGAKIGKFMEGVGKWLEDFFNKLGESVNKVTAKFGEWTSMFATWVGGQLAKFGEWVKGGLDKTNEFLVNLGKGALDIVKKLGDLDLAAAKAFVTIVGNFGKGFVDIMAKFGQGVIDLGAQAADFLSKLTDLPSKLVKAFTSMLSAFVNGLKNVWQEMNNRTWSIGQLADEFLGFFTGLPGKVKSALSGLGTGIKNGMSNAGTWITNGINSMINAISNMWYSFKSAGKGLIDAFWQGAMDKFNNFADWFKDKLQWIRDRLPGSDAKYGPLSTLTRAGKGLVTAMQAGAESKMPGFLGMVNDFAGSVADALPTSDPYGMSGTQNSALAMAGATSSGPSITIQLNGGVLTNERAIKDFVTLIDKELGNKYTKK